MPDERPVTMVLASLEFGATLAPLGLERILFVPTAANDLADRTAVMRAYRSQLEALEVEIVDWDLDSLPDGSEPPDVDAVCCSGGDPYRLLAACRRFGFDRTLTGLVRREVIYVGASAGAMIAGPSLDLIVGVTPFLRPAQFDGAGLRLTERLVLPHDNRPGRRAAHATAQSAHGATHRIIAIADTETITLHRDGWRLTDQASGHRIRPARATDAAAIADCYLEAARTAWTFVDADRFASLNAPVEVWLDRLVSIRDQDDLLVVEDTAGLIGFVWIHPAGETGLPDAVGEVGAFYTRPRVWGAGAGRRLLTLALDRLRAQGCRTAVLYTEERNQRTRRIYEQLTWRADGVSRQREFLGTPIRELRYRLAL